MTNAPIPGPSPGSNPIRGTEATPRPAQQAGATESPAFQVLLDRLHAEARALEEKSRSVADPTELSGALDIARSSLDDALSLGDRLLEAYREAQHRTPSDNEEETSS